MRGNEYTGWVRVVIPNACYALEVTAGVVVSGAPYGRWAVGLPISEVIRWARNRGGRCHVLHAHDSRSVNSLAVARRDA